MPLKFHIALGEKEIDLEKEFNVPGLISKTGIPRVFETSKSTVDLATAACSQFKKEELDAVDICILVTQSPDDLLPANAISLSHNIDLKNSVLSFDINQGCSGFVQGLLVAKKLCENDKTVLLVTADRYRSKLKKGDRSTFAVFSDGAAATIINNSTFNIVHEDHLTDGSKRNLLFQSLSDENDGCIHMSGAEVWMFTRTVVVPQIKRAIENCNLKGKKIKKLFMHQASKVVVEGISSLLGQECEVIPHSYQNFGNSVSSSIPMAMHHYPIDTLSEDEVVILAGFGVGLTSSILVIGEAV